MNSDYKKLREIGKGGMATVYLARQVRLNRLVAFKVLKSDTQGDQEYVKRFFREARITAQLNHPNIVTIIESNYSEGLCYIVTEYIDGGDFRPVLTDVKINLRRKLQIINKVVDALDYAHQQGIVHRDIKPSNILLTKKLEPKLCDFGIATALWGHESTLSRLTQTNESIGTMDYIAPEQKENSKNVDFRADLYSVGIILYEAVSGRKPQGAFPSPKTVNPSIPARLDDCIMKCLQPWPYKRYKNTRNLYGELESIIQYMTEPSAKKPLTVPPVKKVAGPDKTGTAGTADTRDKTAKKVKEPGFHEIVAMLKTGPLPQKLNYKSRLLERIDHSREEDLLQLLADCDGFLKETVIEALGKLKSVKSCPYLIELLSDPYYNKAAANAVGEIGCKEAEFKLFNILISESAGSYIALLPLGKLNSLQSVKEMARYLKSPHDWIRETALEALAKITEFDKTIGYFEEVSRLDESAHIRARAKKILWRLTK
ncbi:MAG: protein kinase [bacterium]|nr:protein kinase [bacterium]